MTLSVKLPIDFIFIFLLPANTEQIDKAKELIKKLQFGFSNDDFDNPVLQNHYSAVEAMALDRDEPEKITDYTRKFQGRI